MANRLQKLSDQDVLLINYLLLDSTIIDQFCDRRQREIYSKVTIDKTTGDLIFGKTKFIWLNHFIGDEKKISFLDFSLKVIAALSGQKNNYDERILKALSEKTIKEAVMKGDYHRIVDSLFDTCRYGNKSTSQSDSQPELHAPRVTTGLRIGKKVFNVRLNSGEDLGKFGFIIED